MTRLVLLLCLFTFPSSVFSQDTTCGIIWDSPVLLSDTLHIAYDPQIVLSGNDTVHITWRYDFGTTRLPYVRSIDGGTTLEPVRELLTDSSSFPFNADWTRIAASHSRVLVFFNNAASGNDPAWMIRSDDFGSNWSTPESASVEPVGEIRSAALSGDSIAVVCSISGQKKILRSTDNGLTWSRTQQHTSYFTDVDLSPGALHLVTLDPATGDTEYRRSTNLGDTWNQRLLLSPFDGHGSLEPVIAANRDPQHNTVIAAWRDERECDGSVGCAIVIRIGLVHSDTTEWLPEQVLTDVPLGYVPSVDVVKNQYSVAWVMDHESTPYAQVRFASDSEWCPSFDPTIAPIKAATGIDVAVSEKGVHVVWSVKAGPSPSVFSNFYRRGRFVSTSVLDEEREVPTVTLLRQNYPNPFNPSTNIRYQVPISGMVELRVLDLLGREVVALVNEKKEAGEHSVEWKAEGLPSGVYYYRLYAGKRIETKKAILIR